MSNLTQEELNRDMSTIGIGRYRAKVEYARENNKHSTSTYGQRIIRGALPKFYDALVDFGKKNQRIKNRAAWRAGIMDMAPERVAYIVMSTVLDAMTKPTKMASLCVRVGSVLDYQRRCEILADVNPKGEGIILGAQRRRGWEAKKQHVRVSMRGEVASGLMDEIEPWSRRDIMNAGVNMIELLRATTGVIEYRYVTDIGKRNPSRYVTPSRATTQWIEEFNAYKEVLSPFWLPSVDTPVPWEHVWKGGYNKSDNIPQQPFIKTTDGEFLRSIKGALPEPMEACNLIQQTPWQVNSKVFQVMQWAWENSIKVGGFPSRDDELLPDRPKDFKTNKDSNLRWRKMAQAVHRRNMGTSSRRMLVSKVIYLAEKLQGNRLFYPSHCDFRGRVYNIPSFLGVQGPDMCRGILQFYRPKKIKTARDRYWLAIQGANTWGYDKVTMDKRVQWAEEFAEAAIRISEQPTKDLTWTEADEPWQFLAWCFEWAELNKTGKLDTRLPINMDATNNGLQILSMLLRDPFGMTATNVLPTDSPADIYGLVAKHCEDTLRRQANRGDAIAAAWVDFGINRKTAKKAVMCYSYGLTSYTNRYYLSEWYDHEIHQNLRTRPFDDDEKFIAIHVLGKALWNSIETILAKPKECMKWFQQCSKILTKAQIPLTWESPSGFPICQKYFNYHNTHIETMISGKIVCVGYRNNGDELSPVRQRNGVSPNFVHSLDAAALHKTVIKANKEYGIYDFAMVHDSYGTHATQCDELGKALREVFVSMFSVDLLRDFKHQLEQASGLELPEPPEYGNADISKISESTYFFS